MVCFHAVTSKSIDDELNGNHVIDNVLKTLNKKPNETMERNHELFCNRRTYKTDLAIGYEGCASYVVEQGYCVGQCSSIYLPDQGSGALSCSMCEVTKRRLKTVKLHCNSGVRTVDIPIVEECGCRACKVNNVIPEPPWKTRESKKSKKKNKKNKNKNKKNKNRKSKRKTDKKRKNKLRNKRKLRQQRKQMRLTLLRAQEEKKKKKAKKHNKQVFTYDDLMKMMYSWTWILVHIVCGWLVTDTRY